MTKGGEAFPRTVLWRRIDREGMDACAVASSERGHEISGTALFLADGGPANIRYHVFCDAVWRSQAAQVDGWVGTERKSFSLTRCSRGFWFVNGERIAEVDGLLDVDLGFTPATNTNAMRRLGLEIGARAKTTAVWLDAEDWSFKPLTQIYRRQSATVFAYASPAHDYDAELVVDDFDLIRVYPNLWQAVSPLDATER